jgi:cyanophycinase
MVMGTYQAERTGKKGGAITDRTENWKGFGLVGDAAIDAHAIARGRQEHLWPIVKKHEELLGLGIDEGTAVVVHGGEFTVIGRGQAVVCDGRMHDGRRYFLLGKGERFSLQTRTRVAEPPR